MGRLDPRKLPSVAAGPARDSVAAVFEDRLGQPLGLDALGATEAVPHLANVKMAGATRMVPAPRGADTRDFALLGFGGAGPLHASTQARELGIPRVLAPCRPGVTNAVGCVVADLRHGFVTTLNTPLDMLDEARLARNFADQATEGEELILREKVTLKAVRKRFSLDMQFIGQTHLLRVALEALATDRKTLRARFAEAYFVRFRVELGEGHASIVNANCPVIGERQGLDLSTLIDPAGRKATLAEANNRSDGIYSARDGALIAQGVGGLPVFVGMMQYSTRVLIERIAAAETAPPEPGDTYVVNAPYLGGTHLMDARFARPFYRGGGLFCWLSNTGHWPDTGGAVPGGFSASAASVEQKGLCLPPVKLFKRGQMEREVYQIICSNIRVAAQRIGDIKAQAAALSVGKARRT